MFSCKEDAACSAGYLIYNYFMDFMDFMDVMDLMAFMAKEGKEGIIDRECLNFCSLDSMWQGISCKEVGTRRPKKDHKSLAYHQLVHTYWKEQ